jgi:hypothetical protein
MFAPMLRQFIDVVRSKRAQLDIDDPQRQFYLGVEAAAQGLLHPEVGAHRSSDWLEREKPEYRDGYLTAVADLTTAISVETPPVAFSVPTYLDKFSSS